MAKYKNGEKKKNVWLKINVCGENVLGVEMENCSYKKRSSKAEKSNLGKLSELCVSTSSQINQLLNC